MSLLPYILYIAMAIAIFSTVMVITRLNAVHALLYFIISLQAVAVVFYLLGAPLVAAMEVIVYAGAIMVLFIFVIMLLNLGPHAVEEEKQQFSPGMLAGPALLAIILMAEWLYGMTAMHGAPVTAAVSTTPQQVGMHLYGPYVLGTELASFLLMAGLIAAYHLGRHEQPSPAGKGDR